MTLAGGARAEARRSRRSSRRTSGSRSCSRSRAASRGMTRHASIHAAGVVIAPKPSTEFVPLYKDQKDEIVTQWAMNELETCRPPQDGLPRAEDADPHRRCARRDHAVPRARRRHRTPCRSTIRRPTSSSRRRSTTASSSSKSRACGAPAPAQAGPLRGSHRAERALPARADQGGMVDDFIKRKQGKTEVEYQLPALEADPRRDLRRHRLSGTGDADRRRAGRLLAGRGRRAAHAPWARRSPR